jgi:hypothetical protein
VSIKNIFLLTIFQKMKNLIKFTLLMLFMSIGAKSQNLQTNYDFDRGHITTTLEMFKPDAYGNTFFFVDMDFNNSLSAGGSLAYMEIARVFKTEKMPIGVHAELNAGLGTFDAGGSTGFFPINQAYLAGVDYSYNNTDFSRGFSLKLLYKHFHRKSGEMNIDGSDKNASAWQFTAVYYMHMLDRKLTFIGFADFWREDHAVVDGEGNWSDAKYIFLAEPQLWYNFNSHFAFGGEVELSNNFGTDKGFKVRPTLGVKWTF